MPLGRTSQVNSNSAWQQVLHGWVTVTRLLTRLVHSSIQMRSQRLSRVVASAGLPHMGVHGLRHTYATLALSEGWNPKIVSERLGHANVAITLDIYSHVTPGLQQDMTDQIAASIDGLR